MLFRITQEALNNIQKHSKATNAEVILRFTPDKVRLAISDNGQGFDAGNQKRTVRDKNGLGLVGMRERANLVGASLKIKSILGKGTTIVVDVPVTAEES